MKTSFRTALRRSLLWAIIQAGRFSTHAGGRILTYHSLDKSGSCISLHPEVFRWHMLYLKAQGLACVSLSRYLAAIREDPADQHRLVGLTFDDGFASFLRFALPTLCELGFSATVFIVTGYVGARCTWEKMSSIPDLPLMGWADIRCCLNAGIEIGSHTVTHPYLTRLGEIPLRAELSDSKTELENRIGREVTAFCYPYGDVDMRVRGTVRRTGYGAAVTTRFRHHQLGDDLVDLPRLGMNRIHPHDHTAQRLVVQAAARGMLPLYDRLKRLSMSGSHV